MAWSTSRIILASIGAAIFLFGLVSLAVPDATAYFGGIALLIMGGGLVIVVVLERTRYRSEHAERTSEPPGPGGGELVDRPLEGRFNPTEEVFVDPTTSRTMRVFVDRETGERRYRAEE
jgi:hypothetical protein